MLKKLEVKNYKCFKNLTLDLSAADYAFNSGLVRDGKVNKALVYGKNGSGKTSLGFAIFDIVLHLTDREYFREMPQNYLNLNSNKTIASFQYTFEFDFNKLVYSYEKTDARSLVSEKLSVNGKVLVDYHYGQGRKFVHADLRGDLNLDLCDDKLSVVKYIYRNTPTGRFPLLVKLMGFCENMLWFRSLSDGNAYCGFTNGNASLDQTISKMGKIVELQDFLARHGLEYKLVPVEQVGGTVLFAQFNSVRNKKLISFSSVSSAGTKALLLFFFWMHAHDRKPSLLFIDEFDAFYHYETAAEIISEINEMRDVQSLLTTHNTYLMQNRFTRPDCCYVIGNGKIKNLKNSTDRELREAHNLEKMYTNGAFVE